MNNKRIAVLLATVMAVSMVAMGFVGTAAASPAEEEEFDGFIAANNVSGDVSQIDHVATINITEDMDGQNPDTIFLNYTDDPIDDISISDDGTDVNVEILSDGTASEIDSGSGTLDVNNPDGTNTVEISGFDNVDTQVEEGDLIRVYLDGIVDESGIDDAARHEAHDVEMNVTDGGSNFESEDLSFTPDGPISFGDDHFYSLQAALDEADEDVTVADFNQDQFDHFDELDETLTQSNTIDGNLQAASVDSSITVEAVEDSDTVFVPDNQGSTDFISLDASDIVVDNIAVNGTGWLDGTLDSAITSGGSAGDAVINNTELFAETGIDLDDEDGFEIDNNEITAAGSDAININNVGDDADISNNVINEVNGNDGILIDNMDANQLNITDNEINDVDGETGINADPSDDGATLTIEETNDIGIEGSDATGVLIDTDGDSPEVFVNDTIVTADTSKTDDLGIVIDVDGDVDADDYEAVIAGDQTDITGTATAIDVDFAAATTGGDHEVDIIEGVVIDTTDVDSATAVDATEDVAAVDSLAVTVSELDVTGDDDATGVDVDDSGSSDTLELHLDTGVDDGSLFTGVDKGVVVADSSVDDLGDISNTTFTDIDSFALELDDSDGTDLTLEDITVNGDSSSATAISYDDGDDLTVLDSELGDTDDSLVNVSTGIEVEDTNSEIIINDTEIHVNDDDAIAISSGGSETLTIDGTDITGDDQSGTGLHITSTSVDEINVNPDTPGSIDDVDTGVNLDDVQSALTLESGLEINDYAGTGVEIDDDATHELSGVHLTEADDAGATGVDITSTVASTITIDYESTIQVADDADSEGVNVNSDDHIIIQSTTIEAKDGSSDGTAIQLDDIASVSGGDDTSIQFNDIEGFTGDGYGLAGDVTDLMAQNATGNWWGDDFGPQHEDASNVDIDVDAGASDAAIYDPFLTEEIEETDLNLGSPAASEVTSFAHDIYVEAGEIETVGFPSYSANELSEGEAYELIDGDEADIVRYDAADQEWFGAAEADETPEGLDAYAVISDDTDVLLKIEYEDEVNVPRGSYTYEEGFNLVPTAASNNNIGSGDDVTESNTFDLANEDDGEFTTGFESPGLQMTPSDQLTTATDGSAIGGAINDVSAFHPMWVFVNEDDTIDRQVSAAFDSDASMQTVLDDIEQ